MIDWPQLFNTNNYHHTPHLGRRNRLQCCFFHSLFLSFCVLMLCLWLSSSMWSHSVHQGCIKRQLIKLVIVVEHITTPPKKNRHTLWFSHAHRCFNTKMLAITWNWMLPSFFFTSHHFSARRFIKQIKCQLLILHLVFRRTAREGERVRSEWEWGLLHQCAISWMCE